MVSQYKLRSQFNIAGLLLTIEADHPKLADVFEKDLRLFRLKRLSEKSDLTLQLTALPSPESGKAPPHFFEPHQEVAKTTAGYSSLTRYGRSSIIVVSDMRSKTIRAGVVPQTPIIPDPAYHYCLTESIQIWLKKKGKFFLHGACVAEGSNGVLILGHSGAGKSTLSVSCVEAGFQFLGDEQPILSMHWGELKVNAFHRRVRMERFMAEKFQPIRQYLGRMKTSRVLFPMEAVWPECIALSSRPRLIIFPEFHPQGHLKVMGLSRSATLGRLLQDEHFLWYRHSSWESISRRHLELFEMVAQRLPAYRLIYGPKDLKTVPAVFRKLLRAVST